MEDCASISQSCCPERFLRFHSSGTSGQGWWLALICAAWLIFIGRPQGRGYLRISRPSLINPDPQFRSPSAFSPFSRHVASHPPAKPRYHSSRHDRIITTSRRLNCCCASRYKGLSSQSSSPLTVIAIDLCDCLESPCSAWALSRLLSVLDTSWR